MGAAHGGHLAVAPAAAGAQQPHRLLWCAHTPAHSFPLLSTQALALQTSSDACCSAAELTIGGVKAGTVTAELFAGEAHTQLSSQGTRSCSPAGCCRRGPQDGGERAPDVHGRVQASADSHRLQELPLPPRDQGLHDPRRRLPVGEGLLLVMLQLKHERQALSASRRGMAQAA